LGLKVLAIILYDYHGTKDFIKLETPILTGGVHFLERGVDASDREMVKVLARVLVSQVRG
jgi:CRISPR-associated protein Csx3